MTEAEKKLWHQLRRRQIAGLVFRKQQPLGPYIVDFCCQKRKLIIEVDGGQHAGSRKDQKRDAFLKSQGYQILRFWNNDIVENIEGVMAVIYQTLNINVDL
jgi:very-short-patch-repair endonuclease